MKVLICVSEYYPHGSGIANVAYNVVEQLKNMGVSCTVCSPTGPDIKLRTIEGYGRLGLIQYWSKVEKYFKRYSNDYDIVWLHNPLFLKNNPFSRSLITMHITSSGVYSRIRKSNYPQGRKIYKKLAAYIEKFCLSRLDLESSHFSAISLQVYDELKSLGISDEKISYIPNGVDTKMFKPLLKKEIIKNELGLPKDKSILLSVGNLTYAKNPLKLLKIYSLIERECENFTLVIAGSGELEKKVKEFSEKQCIKNILFLGHVDYKKMHNFYACSDVYIMTSYYEGLPLTLLEAISSKLPCIVSDVYSISSIVNEAKAGIVVDFDNENEAAQQIIDFLNQDLYFYGENARRFAIKNFDWVEIAQKYYYEFQKIAIKNE